MNTQLWGLITIFVLFFLLTRLGDYCTKKRIEEQIIKSNETNKDL